VGRVKPETSREPAGDGVWDEGLLTLVRYVDLDSPEWVARQAAAAGELLGLPGRRERRAAARREWRTHAKVELLVGLAGPELAAAVRQDAWKARRGQPARHRDAAAAGGDAAPPRWSRRPHSPPHAPGGPRLGGGGRPLVRRKERTWSGLNEWSWQAAR
jgi:hypothetical protein